MATAPVKVPVALLLHVFGDDDDDDDDESDLLSSSSATLFPRDVLDSEEVLRRFFCVLSLATLVFLGATASAAVVERF